MIVVAHKDAPEVIFSTQKYFVNVGMIPQQLAEKQQQSMYARITTLAGRYPVEGLALNFTVYNTYLGNRTTPVYSSYSREVEPGKYMVDYIFPVKGAYNVGIEIYERSVKIADVKKDVFVEPNGPGWLFWSYMVFAIFMAILMARISDKV